MERKCSTLFAIGRNIFLKNDSFTVGLEQGRQVPYLFLEHLTYICITYFHSIAQVVHDCRHGLDVHPVAHSTVNGLEGLVLGQRKAVGVENQGIAGVD